MQRCQKLTELLRRLGRWGEGLEEPQQAGLRGRGIVGKDLDQGELKNVGEPEQRVEIEPGFPPLELPEDIPRDADLGRDGGLREARRLGLPARAEETRTMAQKRCRIQRYHGWKLSGWHLDEPLPSL